MKGFAILCLMEMIAASAAYSTDSVIWPMNPQDGTHNLFHSFGDYHRAWMDVGPSGINFHFGIDLTDPTPSTPDDSAEDVYCVRTGYVTHVFWGCEEPDLPMAHDNYGIVICDVYQQQTGFGWCYQHIEDYTYTGGGQNNNPWSTSNLFFGNLFTEESRLGDIDNDVDPNLIENHLHFMRSEPF